MVACLGRQDSPNKSLLSVDANLFSFQECLGRRHGGNLINCTRIDNLSPALFVSPTFHRTVVRAVFCGKKCGSRPQAITNCNLDWNGAGKVNRSVKTSPDTPGKKDQSGGRGGFVYRPDLFKTGTNGFVFFARGAGWCGGCGWGGGGGRSLSGRLQPRPEARPTSPLLPH